MPGISGLQLVKRLGNSNLLPVFITSHPEFAIESYEIEGLRLPALLKPLAAIRLPLLPCVSAISASAAARPSPSGQEQESDTLIIKQGHEKLIVLRIAGICNTGGHEGLYPDLMIPGRQWLVLATLSNMQEEIACRKIRPPAPELYP